MAIWNFTVEFIPRDELFRLCGAIPDSLAFERFDDHQWWHGSEDLRRINAALDRIFGASEIRGKGMRTWRQGRHSLTVYFSEKGEVEAIAAKADARHASDHFLRCLVDFAKTQRCVLYLSSLEIVLPEIDRLFDAFARSAAKGFLSDPTKMLSDPTRIEFEKVLPVNSKKKK